MRAIIAGLEALGVDSAALVRDAALDPKALQQLDGFSDAAAWRRLWAVAHRHRPSEALPTEVGMAVPFGAFGALDYLVASSAHVAAGFASLADHFRQVSLGFAVLVEPRDRRPSLVRLVASAPFEGQGLSDEFTLAILVARFRTMGSAGFGVSRVRLTRPAPRDASRHVDRFGVPVEFGCAESALEIPPSTWTLPLRRADPALQQTLATLVSHLNLGAPAAGLESAVRARLRSLLPHGTPSAAAVARTLGLSERTMQRRLADSGTTFLGLLDTHRESEAERLLESGTPLSDVALQLGFSDQSTFSRAFRRWKGMAPSRWLDERRASSLNQRRTPSVPERTAFPRH